MRFLAFEGLDGSGKSTLIERLSAELSALGERSLVTHEPGGTPLAEEIRSLLLRVGSDPPSSRGELLLYEASRAQHVDRVIRPALERGEWVICDRFVASTVAFQCWGRGLDRATVDWLNDFAMGGCRPALTVLLDLPVTEAASRQKRRASESGRGADRMELEDRPFHESVRAGYLAQASEAPDEWLVLDARAASDVLYAQLRAHLKELEWLP